MTEYCFIASSRLKIYDAKFEPKKGHHGIDAVVIDNLALNPTQQRIASGLGRLKQSAQLMSLIKQAWN